MASQYKPASLSDNELEEIKELEKGLDKVIVAVEQPPIFADLSDTELARLRQAEKKLGKVMLAYDQA
jgi:predicted phosphohydrolase